MRLRDGDVLVVAQKVVSKAEGQIVRLGDVKPSARARRIARRMGEDARFVEVVLRESRRIVRASRRALIVETRQGFVCANAGVDRSNVPGEDAVTCLPRDPDGSARRLAAILRRRTGARVAVIISDTFGRPWRLGLVNAAIGAAGLAVLRDLRGKKDAQGRVLRGTVLAVADELACAAGLIMGKLERVPFVLVRGYRYTRARQSARDLIRPAAEDLFR
jgi:coenzyme F420-0:L-glutamate ligase/coenzyme F420-1:gamma-L-glutamate ligase